MPIAIAARYVSLLWAAWLASGCAPKLDVGSWNCASAPVNIPADGGPTAAIGSDIPVPWSTSFEDGFCGYSHAGGFCYSDPGASYEIVTSPTHIGHLAAAFHVTSDAKKDGVQTRCVREGHLPPAAYYGAWFFVPAPAKNAGNWNLIHFRGADDPAEHGLWDVSLENLDDGGLSVVVRDFLNSGGAIRTPAPVAEVAIGTWFHVQFFLQRAADATGAVALYVNERAVLQLTNVITEDTTQAQWYVGNLADNVTPPDSTLYVDDVTLSDTL